MFEVMACFILLLALDDDDVAVLDLIAMTGGDLSKPRPLTGSAAKESKSEDYTLDGQ